MTNGITLGTSSAVAAATNFTSLQAGLDLACEAIFVLDPQCQSFVVVNEAACQLAQRGREEVLRLGPQGLWVDHAQPLRSGAPDSVQLILQAPEPILRHVAVRQPDGTAVRVQLDQRARLIGGNWYVVACCGPQLPGDVVPIDKNLERQDFGLERFRMTMDQIDDAISVIDPVTLRYVDVNEAMSRIYGHSLEQMLAGGPLMVSLSSADELRARYQKLIDEQEMVRVEQRVRRADGTFIWMEMTRRAIHADGRWFILSTGRDISERKLAQARLELLAAASNLDSDAVFLIDRESLRAIDVNEAACRLYGAPRESVLLADLWGPGKRHTTEEELAATYDALIARQPATEIEVAQTQGAGGTHTSTEIQRQALNIDGRWIIVARMRDVTEREAVQRDLERFRMAIDQSSDAIALVDPETAISIDINQTGCDMAGVSREENLARGPAWWMPEDTREEKVRSLRETYAQVIAAHPQTLTSEGEFVRANGQRYPVELQRRAIWSENRWVILVTMRDISERKAAQTSLQRFRAAIDEAGDGIVLTDVETLEYLDMNETVCRMFGYTREQMMAMGPTQISAGTLMLSEQGVRERLQEAVDRYPNVLRRDSVYQRPDGTSFDAEVSRRAVKIGDKWVVISTIRDISERKAAQASLQRFRAAIDQSADVIVVIDRETLTYVDVNTTACRFFGYERDEYLRLRPNQLSATPETLEQLAERYDKLVAMAPKPLVSEGALRRKDNTLVEMETIRCAVQVDGKWLILVTGRDISERKAAQASVQRFRAAIDQAGDGIVLIDADTVQYLNVNETACQMFGYSREQMMALGPLKVSAGTVGSVEAAQERYGEAIRAYPELITEELKFPRADGSSFDAEVSRRALSMDGKWIIIATIRDVSERKAAQAGLERFRAAIDQAADGIVLTDIATMNYLDINDTACRMFGYSREQMMELGPVGISAGFDLGDVKSVRWRQQQAMEAYPNLVTRELPFRRADGTTFDAEVSRRALELNGQWIMISSIRDVSERKAAQAKLERFRTAIEQSADSIVMIDPLKLEYIEVNQAVCDMAGTTRDEVMARGPIAWSRHDGTDEEKARALRAAYQGLIDAHPRSVRGESEFRRANGEIFPVESQRRAIQSEGRWIILVNSRDISERKAAQASLTRFRAAMDQVGDAISLWDVETLEYIDINETACRMFGYSREQMMSMGLVKVAGGLRGGFEAIRERSRQVVAVYPELVTNEIRYTRSDGSEFDSEISRRALFADGRWIIVATIRDITERKRSEAQLKRRMEDLARSNQELERFAYVASHDLSEPLRMIASYTQLLDRRYRQQLDDDGREFMGYVISGAQRMKQLIDDLLAYSHSGRSTRKPVPVDMNAVVDEVLANLGQAIADKSAKIEKAVLPVILGDKSSTVRLLQNLVGNAIKFQDGKVPEVRIGVVEDADGWTFSVADNGIGIEPQYFERIFVIFQRLHGRDKYVGTGIGLAICQKIVEHRGGRIWVESQPGQGTCFYFWLPRMPPEVETSAIA